MTLGYFDLYLTSVILYLCYNDGLVLHNLILVIILMLYIIFIPHGHVEEQCLLY